MGRKLPRATFDTCFLIDFEREQRRKLDGRAHRFMEQTQKSPIYLSAVALGEFAHGLANSNRSKVDQVFSLFHLLAVDHSIALRYGRISRMLQAAGLLIGTNDLWIAATAIQHDLPLVTRDLDHFRRVPDLRLIGY